MLKVTQVCQNFTSEMREARRNMHGSSSLPNSQRWQQLFAMLKNLVQKLCTDLSNPEHKRLIKPNGPRQANLVLIAYASSEGSGETAHPRSLARTFAARSYKQ